MIVDGNLYQTHFSYATSRKWHNHVQMKDSGVNFHYIAS